MEKRNYVTPEMSIVLLEEEDVVRTSNPGDNDVAFPTSNGF